jgi:hypothetical protein
LKDNSADEAANLAVGQFYCFHKGDWDKGLPLLARAGDEGLAALAKEDVQRPKEAAAQVKLAQAWEARAEKAEGIESSSAKQRAYYWYMEALPRLDGAEERQVEGRIDLLVKSVSGLRKPWNHCALAKATVKDGFVRLEPGGSVTTRRSYSGAITVTATARTKRNNIRLNAADGGELIFNWEVKQGVLRVHRPDDAAKGVQGSLALSKAVPLAANTWYQISWRITEKGMSVAVNGIVVFAETRSYDLSTRRPVRVYAGDSVIDVQSLSVTRLR